MRVKEVRGQLSEKGREEGQTESQGPLWFPGPLLRIVFLHGGRGRRKTLTISGHQLRKRTHALQRKGRS